MGKGKEKEIVNYLNGKRYKDLCPVWQSLCKEINPQVVPNDEVIAEEIAGNFKADLKIKIGDKEACLSAKDGSGNSVHQEPLPEFLRFCKEQLSASQEVLEEIRWFICERKDARKLYKEKPYVFDKLNDFFEKHLKILLERFLVTGLYVENTADYIYYGKVEEGVYTELRSAIEVITNNKKDKKLHPYLKKRNHIYIGPLTFQAWGRTSKKNRGNIQIKWGKIKENIEYINKLKGK